MHFKVFINYLTGFGAISIIGLAIDFALFQLLLITKLSVFWSSCFSIFCAITFVFFFTANNLFFHEQRHRYLRFAIYVIYQIIMMIIVSAVLNHIHISQIPVFSHPLLLKLLPLPFTFSLNSLVIFLLLRH